MGFYKSRHLYKSSIRALICIIVLLTLTGCETTKIRFCPTDKDTIARTLRNAEAGDSEAQFKVAEWYQGEGECLPRDLSESMFWFNLSAEQGHVKSQSALASLYHYWKKDIGSAIHWYEEASLQGDLTSIRKLGFLYWNGKEIEKDLAEAEKWFSLAAELGDISAEDAIESINREKDPAWQREQKRLRKERKLEQQRLAEERRLKKQRVSEERKRKALDRFGNIGVAGLPTDPDFLREKSAYKTYSESSSAEARGYLYSPLVLISWPALLLTTVVGETGVAATNSAEHTYMQNTVRKAFDESNLQTYFIENLLEAANEQLDNPVTVLEEYEKAKTYLVKNSVNTILELSNGLIKIIAEINHNYNILMEVQYRLIDRSSQNVVDEKIIEAWGKTINATRKSESDERRDIDSKNVRQSLEVAYQKLAGRIIESLLDLP